MPLLGFCRGGVGERVSGNANPRATGVGAAVRTGTGTGTESLTANYKVTETVLSALQLDLEIENAKGIGHGAEEGTESRTGTVFSSVEESVNGTGTASRRGMVIPPETDLFHGEVASRNASLLSPILVGVSGSSKVIGVVGDHYRIDRRLVEV